MGLFDIFKGDSGEQMTPHLGFVIALLYMMSADGVIDNEEIGHLLSVLGGEDDGKGTIGVGAQNQRLLDNAIRYRKKHTPDQFLAEITPMLTDAQKMCILVNLIDSSLSNGQAEIEEQQLFGKFLQAFAITEDRFRPYFEVIVLKNDRSVFTNQNHAKNQPGYKVSLTKL